MKIQFSSIHITLTLLMIGLFCLNSPISAQTSDAPALSLNNLNDYLRHAALNNASLKASYQSWQASLEEIPQAKSLDDPRLTYTYWIKEVETRVGPQKGILNITQTFPWFGTLQAQSDAASSTAKSAYMQYQAEKLKLFQQVKSAYYEYAYLTSAIQIAQDNLDLINHFEQIVRIKYETATASHPDIIRAQIEQAILNDKLDEITQLQKPLTAKLNALLNQPAETPLSNPEPITFTPYPLDESTIYQQVTKNNPELESIDWKIQAAENRINWAQKQKYPKFGLGVNWIQVGDAVMPNTNDSGTDAFGLAFSLNIPFGQSRYNALERQTKAKWQQAREIRVDKENTILSNAYQLLYDIQDNQRKVLLYKDNLIPKADELISTSEVAYRAGTIDFLSLISALQTRLKYTLTYERTKTDYFQNIAKLEVLIGSDLNK